MHTVTVVLHPEVSVKVNLNVARSPEEAELQASGKSIQELAAEAEAAAEFRNRRTLRRDGCRERLRSARRALISTTLRKGRTPRARPFLLGPRKGPRNQTRSALPMSLARGRSRGAPCSLNPCAPPRPPRILCLVAGLALFSVQDLILKLISGAYPLYEAMLVRGIVTAPLLMLVAHVDAASARSSVPVCAG